MPETSAFDPAFGFTRSASAPKARMFPNRRRAGPRQAPQGVERRAATRLPTPAEPAIPPLFRTRAVTLGVELGVSVAIWIGIVKLAMMVF